MLGLLLLGLVYQWLVASDRYSIDSLSHLYKSLTFSRAARGSPSQPHKSLLTTNTSLLLH